MSARSNFEPLDHDRGHDLIIVLDGPGDVGSRSPSPNTLNEARDRALQQHMANCRLDEHDCLECSQGLINFDDDDIELLSALEVAAFRERSNSVTSISEVDFYTDKELPTFKCDGFTYKPGASRLAELSDGDTFIGINSIIERTKGAGREIFISGPLYKRTKAKECMDLLEKKVNEIARIKSSDIVSIGSIVRPRLVIFTNAPWPTFNEFSQNSVHSFESKLVCRLRISADVREGYVEFLRPEDVVDPRMRRPSQVLRTAWRTGTGNASSDSLALPPPSRARPRPDPGALPSTGVSQDLIRFSSVLGPVTPPYSGQLGLQLARRFESRGVFREPQISKPGLQQADDADVVITGSRVRSADEMLGDSGGGIRETKRMIGRIRKSDPAEGKYTFGDAFCGAGGMGSGARAAGFFIKWGFDQDQGACEAYQRNFSDADVWPCSVDQFLDLCADGNQVDVLHLSPPCQPHSPAHTTPGCNDEVNEAAGLCIAQSLKKIRPRIVTLEQTFGITHRLRWFSVLVHQFTQHGYSIRWKVLQCAEYGVPQPRRRLIVLASCPGERLPDFPPPTHNLSKGNSYNVELERPPTIRDVLSPIPLGDGDPSHNIAAMVFEPGKERGPVAQWDQPLQRTILTRGDYVHPDGFRRFTPRELACLQTFPVTHKFSGSASQQKKQIGNAVPPKFAQVILTAVRESLEQTDQEESADEWVVREVVHVPERETAHVEILGARGVPRPEPVFIDDALDDALDDAAEEIQMSGVSEEEDDELKFIGMVTH